MVTTFVLVIPDKDEIVDSAYWPEDLDYQRAYPYTLWEVHARYESCLNAGGPMKCVARVDLEGCPNFDDQFQWAVTEVCRELEWSELYGEFDDPENLSDGPLVSIGYEAPCCGGCADGKCCGKGDCGK